MKIWDDLCTDLLPQLLQDFVRLIGLQATMALVERFGGLRIFIPVRPKPDHQFVQIIGFDNLVKLSKVYGGEQHFELPKATRALLAIRDAQIRGDYATKSVRQLAQEHRLTERHVTRIVGAVPANEGQDRLFE